MRSLFLQYSSLRLQFRFCYVIVRVAGIAWRWGQTRWYSCTALEIWWDMWLKQWISFFMNCLLKDSWWCTSKSVIHYSLRNAWVFGTSPFFFLQSPPLSSSSLLCLCLFPDFLSPISCVPVLNLFLSVIAFTWWDRDRRWFGRLVFLPVVCLSVDSIRCCSGSWWRLRIWLKEG